MPIDLVFNVPLNNSGQKSHSLYIQALKPHLQERYQLVRKNAAKTAERNKISFDSHVTLGVGDRLLVINVCLRERRKLSDRWGETACHC